MYRGFADAELPGRAAHRRLVLYDVKRQLAGAFLDVPFQTATLPAKLSHWPKYMRGMVGI